MHAAQALEKALAELERLGLFMLADNHFASLVSVLVGRPIPGSWWGAQEGKLIYQIANELEAHYDVQVLKLVSGKVTFVHRKLWPAIYSIGTAREDWQMERLSPAALGLLEKLDRDGELFTDALIAVGGYSYKAVSQEAKKLEKNLLAIVEGFRESGKHHRHLQSWPHWAELVNFQPGNITAAEGKLQLQAAVSYINTEFNSKGNLPWRL